MPTRSMIRLARRTQVVRFLTLCLLTTVFAFTGTGCQVNPATGESHFMMLSREEEDKLGSEAAPQFTAEFGGAVEDSYLQQYVSEIGHRMASETEGYFPDIQWEFTLLDSSVINAFALPGGKVFVTRGLTGRMTNEAQLAGVLGHEIGHVTAQHANRRISNTQLFNLGLAVGAVAVGVSDSDSDLRKYGEYAVPALAIGGQVVMLKFGRNEELQADALGMRYMSRVGYDPHGQREVMKILEEASGGGARQAEWLSTHPYPETRIQRIDRMLATDYADTQGERRERRFRDDFLPRLNGLPAPRHGGQQASAGTLGPVGAIGCTCCEVGLVFAAAGSPTGTDPTPPAVPADR